MQGNGRKALMLGIIFMAVIGALGAIMAANVSDVSATPGRTSACNACHDYPPASLDVSTDITAKEVTPGASFAVNVSWAGGGTGGNINEINWPTTMNNSLFSPTPRVPYSGTSSSGSTFSTLTAPATPGTYTVRVFGATGSPFETDYQDIAVTVSSPPPSDTTGPLTTGAAVTPNPTGGAASVILTATVSDTTTGGSNIATAEYFIDAVDSNGAGTAMAASDGNFNSPTEGVTATVSVSGLSIGSHTIYVHGRDAAGNWGPNVSWSFTVSAPPDTTGPLTTAVAATPNPTGGAASVTLAASISDTTTGGSNIAQAEYFVDSVGTNGAGTAMTASNGGFNSPTEGVTATVNVSGLSAGSHTLYVHGRDAAGNWGGTSSVSLTVSSPPPTDTTGPLTSSVAVTPNPTSGAASVTLTANISDVTTGGANIAQAEYFIDALGTNGAGTAMTASDGSLNSPTEGVTSTVSVSGLSIGSHTLYVHGRDVAGNWGGTSSVTLTVSSAPPAPDTTGPLTSSVSASPNPTSGAASVTLTASISDTTTGGSNIAQAEYFVDAVGTNGAGTAMNASDGSLNSPTEGVTATVSVSGLSAGSHTLYVHGRDAAGNWGGTSSVTLTVSSPPVSSPPPADTAGPLTSRVTARASRGTLKLSARISDLTTGGSNITSAEYFIDTVGTNGAGTAMTAADGSFNSVTEGAGATVSISGLTPGKHTIYVHGKDAAGTWGPTSSVTINVQVIKKGERSDDSEDRDGRRDKDKDRDDSEDDDEDEEDDD